MDRRQFIEVSTVAGLSFLAGSSTVFAKSESNVKNIEIIKRGHTFELIASVLKADSPTVNGRIYSSSVLEKIVRDCPPNIIGQFDMPKDSVLCLEQASHIVKELFIDGKYLKAKIITLQTPYGIMLNGLLNDNVDVAFRTAGTGTIDSNLNIGMDFKLIGIHAVDHAMHPL